MNTKVMAGIDVWLQRPVSADKRIGLLTNSVALTQMGIPTRKAILDRGWKLTRLFTPEHGLLANHPDGEAVGQQNDPLTGIPVVSLYGDLLRPTIEQLARIDLMLFDIPDVGCRFYTYLWSMTHMMEACQQAAIPFVVLDRPNPTGGNMQLAEGPMLDEQHCSSFIGRWNIPIRHSCTLGELARFFKETRVKDLQLEVIPCTGWQRNRAAMDGAFDFIPTSPAIRDAETAMLYPGTGLLEGINLNEGRGTNEPFKIMGAPWLDGEALKSEMEKEFPSGIKMEWVSFRPEWGLFARENCNGLRFAVTDTASFRPVAFGLRLIQQVMILHPKNIAPRLYPTIANPTGARHLDRLTGLYQSYEKLMAGEIWQTDVSTEWVKEIGPYTLYNRI